MTNWKLQRMSNPSFLNFSSWCCAVRLQTHWTECDLAILVTGERARWLIQEPHIRLVGIHTGGHNPVLPLHLGHTVPEVCLQQNACCGEGTCHMTGKKQFKFSQLTYMSRAKSQGFNVLSLKSIQTFPYSSMFPPSLHMFAAQILVFGANLSRT